MGEAGGEKSLNLKKVCSKERQEMGGQVVNLSLEKARGEVSSVGAYEGKTWKEDHRRFQDHIITSGKKMGLAKKTKMHKGKKKS